MAGNIKVEFAVGDKVHHWDGKKFIKTAVVKVRLNPVDNVIEYSTSRYSSRKHGTRTVTRKMLLAEQIKESDSYSGPGKDATYSV